MTPDEHLNAFLAYVAGLLGDFDRYVASHPKDLGKDQLSSGRDVA